MIAVYCRQSVDKKDSISIEQQEKACQRLIMNDDNYMVFSDKGFTGANTRRPQFERMMKEVKLGRISKVIVYKVDRISRSLLDFVEIYGIFEEHGVEFLSCSEQFDTSSAMGRATLQIIMVFAELERSMIQKRVRDNFYERAKKGLYLAGAAPFGFRRKNAVIEGIHTSVLENDNEEKIQAVKFMYKNIFEGKSLGETAAALNKTGLLTSREKSFSSTSVGRILRNTVYVRADADVYEYLKSKGAVFNQPIDLYQGKYGCMVYGPRKNRTMRKFSNLHGDNVQLCRHEGIVSSEIWLGVQRRLDENKPVSNSGKGRNTWLTGLTKCSFCGRGVSVVNGQRNGKRYINCGGRKEHKCSRRGNGMTFDMIEDAVMRSMEKTVMGFTFRCRGDRITAVSEENSMKIKLRKNLDEIENLTLRVSEAGETLMKYINGRIETLECENKEIISSLEMICCETETDMNTEELRKEFADMKKLGFGQKRDLAKAFIDHIMIGSGEIEIYYK